MLLKEERSEHFGFIHSPCIAHVHITASILLPTRAIYGDHLAWPLVVGALLVIAKRGAQPQKLAKFSGANCAGPMGNP
jgi:hypothetical protein